MKKANPMFIALIIFIVAILVGVVIFVGLTYKPLPAQGKFCMVDSECVKATCCHADSCVNRQFAPNCTGTVCTMECKPGTLDCGQGSCACVKNECKAVLK